MEEQRNKDVKQANDENMKQVNAIMTDGADKEQTFIMDSLAKFFTSNEKETFATCQQTHFLDA